MFMEIFILEVKKLKIPIVYEKVKWDVVNEIGTTDLMLIIR
jgi:hypothetical protein